MIHLSSIPVETNEENLDWKQQLKQSRIATHALLEQLDITHHPLASKEAEALFELRVPPAYLKKIEPGNPNDPLLLQVLPQNSEFDLVEGFTEDPLDETNQSPIKGLIHKYPKRVLLIATTTCAINCRYCFRRNFPYEEHRQSELDWQAAFEYIKNREELDEVILSGGEPLLLSNQQLRRYLNAIDDIPHIKRIRIHSRLLTTIPDRVDTEFLDVLASTRKQIIIVTHCNHPNELDSTHRQRFSQLKSLGVTLLNQSVLLKGVNDNPNTLAKLSLALFDVGIMPYYLFLLDKVQGAAHFDTPEYSAKSIYNELQSLLPGYLVPRLSIEIPHHHSKTLVTLQGPAQ